MRTIRGEIILPADTPNIRAGLVIVEVRDASLADAPSIVIAEQREQNVVLTPLRHIPFVLDAPEVGASRRLSLRVHISRDGSGRMQVGDLLTTSSFPVPAEGTVPFMSVPVQVI